MTPEVSKVVEALEELPHTISGDGRQLYTRCFFCGGSEKDKESLSILIDPAPGQPMMYTCFRASCGKSGYLKTSDLQLAGITDMDTIMALSKFNSSISKSLDRPFVTKVDKKYVPVNLVGKYNQRKLDYINDRMGTHLEFKDLRDYKIQLSLYDLLDINGIHTLAFPTKMCDLLNEYAIGFISMYSDYLICRDITPKLYTGSRYMMYRIRGTPDPNDTKIYSIPREIDLLNPHSAEINVAEGTFSILGAYLNTDLGGERPNNIWIANCGSGYLHSIQHITRQYGLLKVRINIWSDSEIKIGKYKKLYQELKSTLDIRAFRVYYNRAAEDFGHAKKDIKPEVITIV